MGPLLGRDALVALAAGLLALDAGLLLRRLSRTPRVPPVGGLLAAGAVLAALQHAGRLPADLGWGLALLALAGTAADVAPLPRSALPLLAVPGALLVAAAAPPEPGFAGPLVVVATAAGGSLVASFDDHWERQAIAPPLLAVSLAGLYAAVPDTEEAALVLAAVGPLGLLGWPGRGPALGRSGALVAAGLIAWVAATGGAARPPSVVGGTGCLALLALEPVGRWLAGVRSRPSVASGLAVAAGHLAFVAFASRVAAHRDAVPEAVALLAIAVAVVGGLVVTKPLGVIRPPRDRSPRAAAPRGRTRTARPASRPPPPSRHAARGRKRAGRSRRPGLRPVRAPRGVPRRRR